MISTESIDLIKRHEGKRLTPYRDTEGVLTIGYGRNLEKGISDKLADYMLQEDLQSVYRDCTLYDWYFDLNNPRRAVIDNMMFNLGIGRFNLFKKTIALLEKGDYDEASKEMLRSRWAVQVGNRAVELAEMMRTGEWTK